MIRPIVFGKFCLLERVNVGGMAELYRAKLLNAPHFNRHIAIKRILPNLAADEEFITMFIDEAKITCEMNHPCICQIYELGRLQDTHYIAMEYIAGKDLLQLQSRYRRQKKIMSVAQASFIIAQVAMGLDFAHRAVDKTTGQPLNIVHRDVSPQNVLISYEGLIKLIDFGVAKAASKNSKTQAGVLKGKFGYMSPEQVDSKTAIDHRSDIFALGTLFWELLTGRRLFQGDNDFVTLELVRECKIEPPSKYNHLVPPEVEAICMRALKRDRQYRYQWAGEMSRDLWTFINSQNPPYSQWHLQQWMCSNFQEDLEKEWTKIPIFQTINTHADVATFNQQQLAQAEAAMLMHEEPEEPVRDFEGNIVPQLTDMSGEGEQESFAGAGEFESELEGDPGASLPEIPDQLNPVETPSENPLHQSVFMDAFPGQQKKSGGSAILITLIVLLVLGGAGAAVWFFVLNKDDEASAASQMAAAEIKVSPANDKATITVRASDGTVVAEHTGAVWTGSDLEPGEYSIEVTHPKWETETRTQAFKGGNNSMTFLMRTQKVLYGTANITVVPEDAEVILVDPQENEQTLEGEGGARSGKVIAGASYTLKVLAPGYVPVSQPLSLLEDETKDLEFALEKGVGILRFKGSGTLHKKDAEGNFEKIGKLPQSFDDLDPTVTYEYKVSKKGYKDRLFTVEFTNDSFVKPNKFDRSFLGTPQEKD